MCLENDVPMPTEGLQFSTNKKKARVYVHHACRLPYKGARKDKFPTPYFEGELPTACYGVEDALAKRCVMTVFSILPPEVRREIEKQTISRGKNLSQIEEIRLCHLSVSSICLSGREFPLPLTLSAEILSSIVKAICHGATFSHREEMAEGYLPFDEGIRVGVVGLCQYGSVAEASALREIHTLVFRIPHAPPSTDALIPLCEKLRKHSRRGCLIVSPPRVGKTTMLRMLCRAFASGESALRVAVVDTRCEFSPEDYQGARIDLLSGYGRHVGATIALRTLSPDMLAMDEIGGEGDVCALCDVMRAGVMLLATAHATNIADVRTRPLLSRIVEAGVFDSVLTLSREEGRLRFSLCPL